MKKSVFLLLPLIFLVACGIFKTVTVDQLRMGMTRADVKDIYGPPEKILIVSQTEYGLQEILAYKFGNDIYTLEFMDDRLIRYEFIREDVVYVPPPPMPPPPSLRPIIVHEERPSDRPKPVERPPATKPSTAPSQSSRPIRLERETSRKETPNRRPGSGKTDQKRSTESAPATSETNRQERDSGQSNRTTPR